MSLLQPEILTSIVSRLFRIEEVTWGDPQKTFVVRFRGALLTEDSAAAYDTLAEALRPYDITPLFRVEEGRQTVVLVSGVSRPPQGRISINIALFILTLLSVLFVGAVYSYQGELPPDPADQIKTLLLHIWDGWPFAVSLLGILLAHEFGHYFAGRYHKTAVSLPYFIPLPYPIGFLGTMGAFINMKERPKNKRTLLDIGIAGPLAGLVVAIPVLTLGLALSKTGPILDTIYTKEAGVADVCSNHVLVGQTYTCPDDNLLEGNSILYLGLKYLTHGRLLPAPAQSNQPPLLYWLRYFFTGQPIPLGGLDVMLHPVAWAGWAGILVTFLNLIPVGQLDGGHVTYTLFGPRVRKAVPFILVILLGLGIIWSGWWLWAAIIFFLGRAHAEPLDQITELDPRRKKLAVLVLVIFVLVSTPVPLTLF
jgi:membrane-associated protease RseP (regulator of RpoE activity)